MESKPWKEALNKHLVEFTDRLPSVIDDIIRRMRCHISNEEYEEMKCVNRIKRVEALIDSIRTRTIEQFNDFCQALVDVKQNDLAEKLSKSQKV